MIEFQASVSVTMLRRLSPSVPRVSTRPIVRRHGNQQFYETEGYMIGATVTAAFGYAYSFFHGMDASYNQSAVGLLSNGLAHCVFIGTFVGLPIAATWPVSVPVVALIAMTAD